MLEQICQFLLQSSVSTCILLLVAVGWYFIGRDRARTNSLAVVFVAVFQMMAAFILMIFFAGLYLQLDAQPGNLSSATLLAFKLTPGLLGASGIGMICGWLRTEFQRGREVEAIIERM
ncbi:MAG: hypothetical protein K2W82_11045 [Candidatus Obscuribacterales bacterium]|nr:hypothetical protein [Candidatus Obscuribacterales bacterium]